MCIANKRVLKFLEHLVSSYEKKSSAIRQLVAEWIELRIVKRQGAISRCPEVETFEKSE